ncbi:hypothetical protein [Paraburkholderia sp. Ac-20342]|nr:hypothetical protein [Paraburkholderia sp. Ac-20342]
MRTTPVLARGMHRVRYSYGGDGGRRERGRLKLRPGLSPAG